MWQRDSKKYNEEWIERESNRFKNFHVYALLLNNGKIYIGQTGQIKLRIYQHFHGRGCRETSINKPLRILYIEKSKNRVDALHRESFLKDLARDNRDEFLRRYPYYKNFVL